MKNEEDKMEFRTVVDIKRMAFAIEPLERMLLVGSCFADGIGSRFQENKFRATVNPYGTMYNPASVLHTVERFYAELGEEESPRIVFMTLGTNHVYRLKSTGEIVDNCQKRPANLFCEEALSVDECAAYLTKAIQTVKEHRSDAVVVVTVSPIRYRKYGYHESQLSKATLLLAADKLTTEPNVYYFPAYEILMDELRDYRFYKPDMIHPSAQAVDYIWERLTESCLSPDAKQFLKDWAPIKAALQHRPFNPESEEYQLFLAKAKSSEKQLLEKYT